MTFNDVSRFFLEIGGSVFGMSGESRLNFFFEMNEWLLGFVIMQMNISRTVKSRRRRAKAGIRRLDIIRPLADINERDIMMG